MPEHETLPGNTARRGASSLMPSPHSSGGRRLALRLGVLAASLGCAWVATSQSRPDFIASRFGLPALTGEDRTTAELANLAGFQRRGNTLVGEVRTREGATMRLVFDARTHTLIGLRVVETAGTPVPEMEPVRGCINQSSAAPMPESARSAP